jgi:NAD(P)-dependent dehydrogenase (short-subunit alcohol dehydrogenase family)
MIKSESMLTKFPLDKKIVLVTGAARRIGRALAIACALAGADVFIHYGHSKKEALATKQQIISMGRRAWIKTADLSKPDHVSALMSEVRKKGPIYALINSAAIFEPISMQETTLIEWERHFAVNLTAPFLLSQEFARQIKNSETGCIVNILDWRALRPGADHFPYSVSKSGLAALTKSMAISLAPNISVNGLALGAILPPTDNLASGNLLKFVPAARWGQLTEVEQALIFLLTGSSYITGEIIHVDGGRHLV